VVVGTDLANRTWVETEKLIGFFVNLLPIRTRFSGDPAFEKILQQVRETSFGAFAHQDVPFDKLVEELQPTRSLAHNPLVQVLFVMQNTPQVGREFGGLKLSPLGVSSTSRFDLVLFINDPEGVPSTMWTYNPTLFEQSSIARLSRMYENILRSVAVNPKIKISSLAESLSNAEIHQLNQKQQCYEEASLRKLKTTKRRVATEA
jgi:non-ribosomal peptide synthetase component F